MENNIKRDFAKFTLRLLHIYNKEKETIVIWSEGPIKFNTPIILVEQPLILLIPAISIKTELNLNYHFCSK